MSSPPCLVSRIWRLYAGPNPLLRRCDRAEGILISIVVLVAVVAAPIAATAGADVADHGIQRVRIEAKNRYPGTATTLQQAPGAAPTPGSPAGAPAVTVAATWTAPDGGTRTGTRPVPPTAPAGTEISIWTDKAGNPTTAPYQPADAIATGVAHGLWIWLAVLAALASCYGLTHLVLNQVRYAIWTREWECHQHDAPD